MNKRQLVDKIAEEADITKAQATRALDSFVSTVRTSLERGDRVTLVGFGSFAVSHRKARRVLDPRNGEPLSIEARSVARFVPGIELKEAIDKLSENRTLDTCASG